MIELKNLSVAYGKKEVIGGLSLEIENGCLTAIIGPNACGKSTLLKAIAGVIPLASGEMTLDGKIVPEGTERAKRISYLPQGNHTPEMTVKELVLQGRFPRLVFPKMYGKADRKAAEESIIRMGLEELSDSFVPTLSGGMKQRAFVAMTLATGSDHLLLDEPTAYLDVAGKVRLMRLLCGLALEGHAVVSVIHEIDLALKYADKICVMEKGNIAFCGTSDEVFESGVLENVFGISLGRVRNENGYCYYYEDEKAGEV